MAASDSTETLCVTGAITFHAKLLSIPELEKISCSIKGQSFVHPLELMGKHIRFAEVVIGEIGISEGTALESAITSGNVLAVHLGSISHGIGSSLLILEDHGFDPYYVDISKLTVLEVFQ